MHSKSMVQANHSYGSGLPPDQRSKIGDKFSPFHRTTPLSIALKWSLAIATLITVGMGLLGWVLISQQAHMHNREMELFGHTIAEQFARSASEPLLAEDLLALEVLADQLLESNQILGVAIYSADGKPTIQSGLSLFPNRATPERLKQKKWFEWAWQESRGKKRQAISFYRPITFQGVVAGYVLVTMDRDLLDQELFASVRTILVATVGLIFITVFMSFLLGRSLSRPIKQLAEVGEAMGKGEFNFRIPDRRRDEIGQIIEAYNRMAASMLEKGQVEAALSRYVSSNVARNILTNLEHITLGGERVDGSVLFCDIVGYTEMSENLPPDQVAELLNEYFGFISLVGQSCQGMVDKFIGDCVMVVFGVPDKDEHHGLHAISCAMLIQQLIARLNRIRQQRGQRLVKFRIGISSGQMLAGNMGAEHRMQYTVVGDTVNLAARLCPLAEVDKIVISKATADQEGVTDYVFLQEHLPIRIRGRTKPVTPYTVTSLDERLQNSLNGILNGILPSTHESYSPP